MGKLQFQTRIARIRGRIQRKAQWLGLFLIPAFAVCKVGIAQCTDSPTVWMNERTAASHLVVSRAFVFPAQVPVLAHIRRVAVIVTVNRKGRICAAKAAAGPRELRQTAEGIVRISWHYRPFFLDGKRAVVQFPVMVNFVLPADKRDVKMPEIADILPESADPTLRAGSSGAPKT